MAAGAGLVVANNYYNQPLLNLIAKTFNVTEAQVSNIPLATQLGYAFGLLFIIPLGDKFSRRKIILIDFIAIIVALIVTAMAPSLLVLTISSFCVGFASVVPQLFVPMAAQLATEEKRGKAIGIVMSGLLIGILGSRFLSGMIGEYYGWRFMYYLAAGIMVIYATLLYFKLPDVATDFKGTYAELMRSLLKLFRTKPDVRIAALRGALGFAGFSAFWTTLVFLMEANFGYGSGAAGLFGVLGMIGALGATLSGRLNDKYNSRNLIYLFTGVLIISWIVFQFSGTSIIGLVIGVLFVDFGLQCLHVTNQNIIFKQNPDARNRVNTIYMVIYFIGGALGTVTGAHAWQHYQWNGVATLGLVYSILIIMLQFLFYWRYRR
ncbi:Predicted arabinose efflux permease, MFS family [Leeuwenhoekiella marinoflava DSM 3653]|uniref:Predicted arabinose efflux permease, MFS family n=3 Tax=Leeuwenhoekiella marinoflava TaxID=988 RepID=A0ABY1HQY6_9FLAO|nr:putative MFS family arabinose efflux permease [Leeuwenhoekiella marinoflava]SHF16958.1 Predicted arabinose efflux permease, MFS family [Leeuwenhoekiella marinoflava DSM 3653]